MYFNGGNISIVVGRLRKSPTLYTKNEKEYITFLISTRQSYAEDPEVILCRAEGAIKEQILRKCKQGTLICVTGLLRGTPLEKSGVQYIRMHIDVKHINYLADTDHTLATTFEDFMKIYDKEDMDKKIKIAKRIDRQRKREGLENNDKESK